MQTPALRPPIQDADIVDEGLKLQTDTRRVARIGLWVLGIGFGGFLVWAAVAPLDEGVPTMGTVTIDTKRKPVQHLAGGTVKEVLVREGQAVEEGQPLVRLSDATIRAEWESVRQQYFGLRAMEGRLMAEQLGSTQISFSQDLLAAAEEDPEIARHVSVQKQLALSRRSSIDATLASIRESVRGLEAQIESYERMMAEREQQRALMRQQLAGIRDLVAEGYAPRNQQLELERSLAEIAANVSDLQGRQMSARQSILELKQRSITQMSEFQKTTDTELAGVRREVGGILQVQHHRLLAAMCVAEPDAVPIRARADLANRLARWRFHLDHLGAVVGHDGGQIWPRQEQREVENADAIQLHRHTAPSARSCAISSSV